MFCSIRSLVLAGAIDVKKPVLKKGATLRSRVFQGSILKSSQSDVFRA